MTEQELSAVRERLWRQNLYGDVEAREAIVALLAHVASQAAEVARLREALTEAVYSFTQPTYAGREGWSANVYTETLDRWRAALAQEVDRGE